MARSTSLDFGNMKITLDLASKEVTVQQDGKHGPESIQLNREQLGNLLEGIGGVLYMDGLCHGGSHKESGEAIQSAGNLFRSEAD
jgi:hypothetical protein